MSTFERDDRVVASNPRGSSEYTSLFKGATGVVTDVFPGTAFPNTVAMDQPTGGIWCFADDELEYEVKP